MCKTNIDTDSRGQQRDRRPLKCGQVIREVIEGFELPGSGILQDLLQPTLGLAREQRYTDCLGALKIGVGA